MKCLFAKCKFPTTCNWNKLCMQKELDKSLNAKKIKTKVDDRGENHKPGLRKPGG